MRGRPNSSSESNSSLFDPAEGIGHRAHANNQEDLGGGIRRRS